MVDPDAVAAVKRDGVAAPDKLGVEFLCTQISFPNVLGQVVGNAKDQGGLP